MGNKRIQHRQQHTEQAGTHMHNATEPQIPPQSSNVTTREREGNGAHLTTASSPKEGGRCSVGRVDRGGRQGKGWAGGRVVW